jgi:uncharacterized protein YlxP (DUF503 family)
LRSQALILFCGTHAKAKVKGATYICTLKGLDFTRRLIKISNLMKKTNLMYIGTCKITIEIPEATSIKDKRNELRSIIARLQRELHISAAEVGWLDEMDLAEIGLAYVSNSVAHADAVIAKAVNFVEANLKDGIMGDYQTEVIRAF